MSKRHIHADLIHAWAEGAEIEYLSGDVWVSLQPHAPLWFSDGEYRIKPTPKPDVVRYCVMSQIMGHTERMDFCNLKIVIDGETGKLKSAEVL